MSNPFFNVDLAAIERRLLAAGKKKQPKIVVPPREERLEQMGDPKPPKIGTVRPTKVEIPEVDDLLEKLRKITTAPQETNNCDANCKCGPCLAGQCHDCHVEALRNEDKAIVRAAVKQWRGVTYA